MGLRLRGQQLERNNQGGNNGGSWCKPYPGPITTTKTFPPKPKDYVPTSYDSGGKGGKNDKGGKGGNNKGGYQLLSSDHRHKVH